VTERRRGALETASAGFERLLGALAFAAAVLVGAMVVLITLNVALRGLGRGGIVWTDEVSEYALYGLTLLAAPWLLRRAAHIRIDALLTALPPRLGWRIEILADVAGLVVALVFAWYGLAATVESYRLGALTIKSLVFPEWWLIAPLPVAFLLLAIEFVFRLWSLATGARRPTQSATPGLA
jgi:TRAP-type transport system small permease protein